MCSRILVGLALFSIAGAATAKPPTRAELNHTSWGKPGVSFEDYRIDAGLCAYEAMRMDISDTPAAQKLVMASRALDAAASSWMNLPGAWGGQAAGPFIDAKAVERGYRVDMQFDAIRDLQYHALRECLVSRGYKPFRLTEDQAKQLAHYRHGDLQRQKYLYRLGTDASTIEAQAIPVEQLQ